MTPEQIQDLLDRLFEIGGAVASNGWRIAMRQVYVEMVTNAVWFFVVLGVVVVLAIATKKVAKQYLQDREDLRSYPDSEWKLVVLGTLLSISIVLPFLLNAVVVRLVNPEWYAVRLLLDIVRGPRSDNELHLRCGEERSMEVEGGRRWGA